MVDSGCGDVCAKFWSHWDVVGEVCAGLCSMTTCTVSVLERQAMSVQRPLRLPLAAGMPSSLQVINCMGGVNWKVFNAGVLKEVTTLVCLQ